MCDNIKIYFQFFMNIQHRYFDTAEVLQIDMAHTGYKHN